MNVCTQRCKMIEHRMQEHGTIFEHFEREREKENKMRMTEKENKNEFSELCKISI